jgi:putative addiction module component (TIGR02574 family)
MPLELPACGKEAVYQCQWLWHSYSMTIALKKKADALLAKLKPDERVELADMLYASLPREYENAVERAWKREIDRRLDEYEAGKVETIPSREVHSGIRRKLNEIKARRISSRRAS